MSQEARERSMAAFRAGKKDILVATEVAARGIDVDDVTHVINYSVPEDEKAYLHRVGRTGRAGRTGIAVTFVDWDDLTRWSHINQALDFGQPDPLETYSSSKHLFVDLSIPEGTKGRIKAASPKPASEKGSDGDRGRGRGGDRKPNGDRDRGRGQGSRSGGNRGEGSKTEQHGDHEHKTPSAGNRNRQRRRTRGGQGGGQGGAPQA
jgi:superfamily II DNA/RNA helicase